MTDSNQYTGSEKGRAFYGFAFVSYGLILAGMLIGAMGNSLLSEPYVRTELNTLRLIIPFAYLPAAIFFFARVRVYIVCLIAAYAYDLWFRLYSAVPLGMLLTNHPVWTACVLFTLLLGLLYRGFRFRWWFKLPRREQRNSYLE